MCALEILATYHTNHKHLEQQHSLTKTALYTYNKNSATTKGGNSKVECVSFCVVVVVASTIVVVIVIFTNKALVVLVHSVGLHVYLSICVCFMFVEAVRN